MFWGKQRRYCPNCGKEHYDTKISTDHVKSMCCDEKCRSEWELKYARMILGHDEEITK